MLVTYLLFVGAAGYLGFEYYTYKKNKANGYATSIRPLQLGAAAIVLLLAAFGILTNQTYEDIMAMFR